VKEVNRRRLEKMFAIKPVSPAEYTPNRFEGQTILITGAAIGAVTAIRASREGANVVCVDRKTKELEGTVSKIANEGHNAIAVLGDVSKTADADRMVQESVKAFGNLDLALNAAGVLDGGDPTKPLVYERDKHLLPRRIHEATDEYWDNVLANNTTGMFKSLRAELRQMVKQGHGGAIVNVGSFAGLTGLRAHAAYVASKHAVTGLTRSAAIDYAEHGIRVNSVNPAGTETAMAVRFGTFVQAQAKAGRSEAEIKAIMLSANQLKESLLQLNDPEHRIAKPEEQTSVILFLLSDDASYLTGGVYATDGGYTAY
jgi:NAD(P)-dependent dehydrogenase (short-subunit alcohol dehydrogenase family)